MAINWPTDGAIESRQVSVNISRLRLWFAGAAIVLAAVVAGFYFYGRMRMRQAINEVPRQLGVNVQQSTEGFTFSRSEGGRTLFTVHASRAIQYKQSGRAELRDVSIIVYGRKANRFDQIYGADFEYDPQTGNISARGDVHIDLEGNAEGPLRPDQAQPQELKNPIHLKTSGLIFNQKTGVAETGERIEFRVPQASGSAMGATYDSKAAVLTLKKEIRVRTNEPRQSEITATHAVIAKGPNRAILDNARMQGAKRSFSTRQFTIFFRDDNTIERAVASGDVRATETSKSDVVATAARAEAAVEPDNALRALTITGGVDLNSSGQDNLHATAAKVLVAFGGRDRVEKVTASGDVRLLQQPPPRSSGRPVELASDTVDFLVQNGRVLTQAVTSGMSRITIFPGAGATGDAAATTVATAGQFDARFQRNRPLSVTGMPDARLVTSSPGQADRITTSQKVEVTFSPTGGLSSLVQVGGFHYLEDAAGARREAWADKAEFSASVDSLSLSGSPRVVDGGMTTTAESIRIDRRSGDASASGDVKTTYSELKPQPTGALLAAGDPIHVTARSMVAKRSTGTARYVSARLWQGANVLEAPVLDFQREPRRIDAYGHDGQGITTIFVEQDKNGRVTPVNVSAAAMTYTDTQRRAHFAGGVTVRGADTTVTAKQIDVYLRARGSGALPSTGPSQLDKIVAQDDVVIQQPNRRATGQVLEYTAVDGRFVLTGGPPSIFDAERGKVTGDSLTFYQRDDRVLVESKSSPTVTQTRVAK